MNLAQSKISKIKKIQNGKLDSYSKPPRIKIMLLLFSLKLKFLSRLSKLSIRVSKGPKVKTVIVIYKLLKLN